MSPLLVGADCVPGNEKFMPPVDWWAGYIDGAFQSFPTLRALAGGARPVLAYTVLGHPVPPFSTPKLILDVETGDPVLPAGVAGWFRQELALGWPMDRLATYASSSRWEEIDADVASAGVAITGQNRMAAQYDGVASLNTIERGGGQGFFPADHFGAKQYSDKGGPVVSANGSHAYDLSVATPAWVGTAPASHNPQEDIVAITCGANNDGAFHVFVERADGSVDYTYQKKGDTSWQGGKPGVGVAALQNFAPAPAKK